MIEAIVSGIKPMEGVASAPSAENGKYLSAVEQLRPQDQLIVALTGTPENPLFTNHTDSLRILTACHSIWSIAYSTRFNADPETVKAKEDEMFKRNLGHLGLLFPDEESRELSKKERRRKTQEEQTARWHLGNLTTQSRLLYATLSEDDQITIANRFLNADNPSTESLSVADVFTVDYASISPEATEEIAVFTATRVHPACVDDYLKDLAKSGLPPGNINYIRTLSQTPGYGHPLDRPESDRQLLFNPIAQESDLQSSSRALLDPKLPARNRRASRTPNDLPV